MKVSNLYKIEWDGGRDRYIVADSFSEAETMFKDYIAEQPGCFTVNVTSIKLVGDVIHEVNYIKYEGIKI